MHSRQKMRGVQAFFSMEASMESTVEVMEYAFLTIADAADKTGRSPSTIRRLIRAITDVHNHVDREGIEPAQKTVDASRKKGENFTWKIREDVLVRNLESAQNEEKKIAHSSKVHRADDVIEILRKELDLKNQHIAKQWEVIQSLNDRLREGNILMGSLQQRLALPAADVPSTSPSPKAFTEAAKKISKKAKIEALRKASMKASRRGLLSWIFR